METAAALEAVARETGFSEDAVAAMLRSLQQGHGTMAQFDHPEFGGYGQWMRGGMIMVSDFSDTVLKRRVEALCDRLAELLVRGEVRGEVRSERDSGAAPLHDTGWPAAFGSPSTSGAQNDVRYAWFADARRLVIDDAGRRSIYDTADHRIGGVAQQQGGVRALVFTSQSGPVSLDRLVRVDEQRDPVEPRRATGSLQREPAQSGTADPFDALERLAELRDRGVIGDADFAAKKAELLKRI